MSQEQLHQATQQQAKKFNLNLGQIGQIVAVVQNHPEILQLIQLAASLKGNPNLIGEYQEKADKAVVGLLLALSGVTAFVEKAEQTAGLQPTPMFADLKIALDQFLTKYGPQVGHPAG